MEGKREGSRSQKKTCFWVVAFPPNWHFGGWGRITAEKLCSPVLSLVVSGFLSSEEKESLFTSCEELAKGEKVGRRIPVTMTFLRLLVTGVF